MGVESLGTGGFQLYSELFQAVLVLPGSKAIGLSPWMNFVRIQLYSGRLSCYPARPKRNSVIGIAGKARDQLENCFIEVALSTFARILMKVLSIRSLLP